MDTCHALYDGGKLTHIKKKLLLMYQKYIRTCYQNKLETLVIFKISPNVSFDPILGRKNSQIRYLKNHC